MRSIWYSLVLLTLTVLPLVGFAQFSEDARDSGFVPLVGIPGLDARGYNVNEYINALYVLSISVAAFLVVLRLILAGLQYMFSDIVTNKEAAKKDIRNAFVGLFIVVGAVIILNTINPQLTNLTALSDIREVTVELQNQPRVESIPDQVLATEDRLDTVEDVRDVSQEELIESINNCESDPDNPGRWVVTGTTGRCLGNESQASQNNTINTTGVIDNYLNQANLPENEALAVRRQYNQFVGSMEPENLTQAEIDAITEDYGASDVMFIVSRNQEGAGTELIGYEAQQEAMCERLTGANNFVISGNYGACLVE